MQSLERTLGAYGRWRVLPRVTHHHPPHRARPAARPGDGRPALGRRQGPTGRAQRLRRAAQPEGLRRASPRSPTVLQTELVEAAREYARSEGYHFMGPVRVELAVDESSRSRAASRSLATLRQADERRAATGRPAPAAGGRAGAAVGPARAARRHRRSRSGGCRRAPSRSTTRTSAGATPRSAPTARTSWSSTSARRTARCVNGIRIHGETALSDGDIISFGSTYVRFEAS